MKAMATTEQRAGATRVRVLLVGVGGQGVLTAARAIGDGAVRAGENVVIGQLHGMAQRGGSVEATVVVGPGRSAFIGDRDADIVLGLEPLEVLRALPKMSERTHVVMCRHPIVPTALAQRGEPYPSVDGVVDEIREAAAEVVALEAAECFASPAGRRTLNVFMLGALAGLELLPLGADDLFAAIERQSAPRRLEANRAAFARGMELAAASSREPDEDLPPSSQPSS